ncbi:MAG: phosphoglycerate dehydrogenase-like enzyme [Acidimicrobiales bacterium]|jgi:phosphoglycerate dehydrogenase-like enzyme
MVSHMKRVAILNDYQSVALSSAEWSVLDGRVEIIVFDQHIDDVEHLVAALDGFEIIVAMRERTPFPRSVLERLGALELLVTTGNRNAAIDAAACADLGITYCGTGGRVQSTAELTWALILGCARHLPTEVGNVADGGWMTTVGTDLHGATLGLCGLGRIGAMVAEVGKAFGMELIAWSQNLTEERCGEIGAQLVSKQELFERSDFLSVHLVLSERSTGLVGEPELRAMKPSAWLINTSRGPICDEETLAVACRDGWIAGAGLDAYGTEPLPADHPFRTLDNVLATPHIGYVSKNVYEIFFTEIVADIVSFLDGEPIRVIEP